MVIHCQGGDCGKPAPDSLQWRLLLAFNILDLMKLYSNELDALACPYCGARASIRPSLVCYFMIEDALVILDRGFDPELPARCALEAMSAGLSAALEPLRVDSLAEYKAVVAAKVKAAARNYPYPALNPAPAEQDIANWRSLQGEIVSAILAGAQGSIPNFGVETATQGGERDGRARTIEFIHDLVVNLVTSWSTQLPTLTRDVTMEEALIRLIDGLGAAAWVADRLQERLDAIWGFLLEHDADFWAAFHFLAVDASLHLLLGRTHPRAGEWAQHYLASRYGVRRKGCCSGEDHFRLSATRVEQTISFEHGWNAVAAMLGGILKAKPQDPSDAFEALVIAVEDLGRPGLLEAVLEGGFAITPKGSASQGDEPGGAGEFTPEAMARRIAAARAENSELSIGALVKFWRPPWLSDADAVARLYDLVEPLARTDDEQRAELMAWFGVRMKLLGAPKLALARIGRATAPWEEELSRGAKRSLWTERSNALRLAGDLRQALKVAEATLEMTLADPDAPAGHKATAWSNCGILLRETGQHSKALEALMRAIELAPEGTSWQPLQSLATTYLQTGRVSEAAAAVAAARETAGGADLQDMRIALLVTEIAIRMQLGETERAEALLHECPSPDALPDSGLINYVTILKLLGLRSADAKPYRSTVLSVVSRLVAMTDALLEAGNPLQAQNSCHAAASLAQTFDLPQAEALWAQDAEICDAAGRLPPPDTAIELAICAIREDPELFWVSVAVIPSAIRQSAAGVLLSSATMAMLSPLDEPFERLAKIVFEQELGPGPMQMVAELRRNAHRKAARTKEGDQPELSLGVMIAEGATAGDPPFLVLEWCDLPGGFVGLVTRVAQGDGLPDFFGMDPELDFAGEAARIGARLGNWHAGRAGQPFETLGWGAICRELRGLAEAYLPGGGHVVIIDHPNLAGIPFHIALAPEWTVSYGADWSAITTAVENRAAAPPSPRLGVLHAPRSNETPAVRAALQASADRLQALAEASDLELVRADPGGADAAGLYRLLAATDLLKLLCHGQISKDDHQVVLLLDHDGRSPPGFSFGATLSTSRGHRFGRDELGGLAKSPSIIFLGACSAGAVTVAGLDERTSFASTLAKTGTKAVVAPRWNIDAELALPVLDDALSRFIDGATLIEAVSSAAYAAVERGVPPWQAHAFVIEGAWA